MPKARFVYAAFAALVLLWGGANVWFFTGTNHELALKEFPLPDQLWDVVEGKGSVRSGSLIFEGSGRLGAATIAAEMPRYPFINSNTRLRFRVSEFGDVVRISVGVAPPNQLFRHVVETASISVDGSVDVRLDKFGVSVSEIGYVIIQARGSFESPLIVEGVSLVSSRPSFYEFQSLLLRAFFSREVWTLRSVNHQAAELSLLRVSPNLAVFCWILLSIFLYWCSGWKRLSSHSLFVSILCFCLIGWFVLDAQWQFRLLENHRQAIGMFWGISVDQKRMLEPDGQVYELVSRLKDLIGDPDRRVVIFANEPFFALRARFFAVPQVVIAWQRAGLRADWIRRLRAGDVVLLIGMREEVIESPVFVDSNADKNQEVQDYGISEFVGENANVITINDRLGIQMDAGDVGAGPTLLDSGCLSIAPGLWQLETEAEVLDGRGWIRFEVLKCEEEDVAEGHFNWRFVHLERGVSKTVQVPFLMEEGQAFRIRARVFSPLSPRVTSIRLVALNSEGVVMVSSSDNNGLLFFGRKVVESAVDVSYIVL